MIQRFQIEDLVEQDTSGVVFRALDTETDSTVALRRFFPHGPAGGGLQPDEQIAYQIAIGRLSEISHPGLRSILCGGCDPVDGMPFIVTEWIPGAPLQQFIERQPLSPAEGIGLLTRLLEVCELLSKLLAEEAVWVETSLQTIIVGEASTGRGITFWVSPFKWMADGGERRDLDSLITLTEEIMGWHGKVVSDQAARGLGGWLKWLRSASKTTSLHEAAEMLAAATGIEPPTPTKALVRQATRPKIPTKSAKSRKRSINGTAVAIIVLALVAAGLGGWAVYRKDPHAPKPSSGLSGLAAEMENRNPPSPPQAEPPAPALETRETAVAVNEKTPPPVHEKKVEAPVTPPAPPAAKSNVVFTPNDPLIVQQEGREVVVEGVVAKFGYSKTGKTLYLFFSENPKGDEARGAILINQTAADLTEKALAPLIGKKVRITGRLELQKIFNTRRPEISILNRAAIE